MATILQRIAAGEQAAVGECVREYGGLVYRIAARHLDSAGSEVDDAVQEVFMELWLSASRFDLAKGSEPAFVATIAHRRTIDRRRQASARRRHAAAAAGARPAPSLADAIDPASGREEVRRLAAAFDGLPDAEREALWMNICAGLSHSQIGTATGSPIGTVKSRLRRAMMRLTEAMLSVGEGVR